MGVQTMKHAAQLKEWKQRITECRHSGQAAASWCRKNGINAKTKTYYHREKQCRETVEERRKTSANPIPGPLVRIEPEMLSCPEPEKENKYYFLRRIIEIMSENNVFVNIGIWKMIRIF